MPSAYQSLVERLVKSRLISESELAGAKEAVAHRGERAELLLVNRLVEQGTLTAWQGLQLLGGRVSFHIGSYKLLQRVGHGGVAAVYKAQHTEIGHIVALKVFPESLLEQPDSAARFRRETQASVRVNHPNVVAGYGGKLFDGRGILIMELVNGDDLNRWLKRCGRLPIDWCCEVARQAALGLEHIHQRGLVHRDIKPSNILVVGGSTREPPHVKIADLGAANIKFGGERDAARTQLTAIDGLLGTPNYIAPEQVVNGHTADHRADIFSLGCTLFKLLTNDLPWSGDTLQKRLTAKMNTPPRSAGLLRSDVPPRLEGVLQAMLARDPEKRYASAAEVADEVAEFTAWRSTGRDSTGRDSTGRNPVGNDQQVAAQRPEPPPILRIDRHEAETLLVETGRERQAKQPAWQWRLLKVSLQGATESYLVRQQDTIVIGRARECHVRVRDVQVSRHHCQLAWRGDNWQIDDLGSNNGTHVNGQPTKSCVLKSGDQIRIGSTRLWLLAMSDADIVATAGSTTGDPMADRRLRAASANR